MISREEYNEALDVIEAYHSQLFYINNDIGKTTISDWMSLNINISKHRRLYNVLRCLEINSEFIENLDEIKFMKYKNAGISTWKLFKELRGY